MTEVQTSEGLASRAPAISSPGLLQALTTEHFTLQTARSATIADSNGRSALYLSTVSGAVVALAFIGQIAQVGQPFFLFALALLPALFLLGVLTCLDRPVLAPPGATLARRRAGRPAAVPIPHPAGRRHAASPGHMTSPKAERKDPVPARSCGVDCRQRESSGRVEAAVPDDAAILAVTGH